MVYLILAVMPFLAGIVQGVTGFGSAIVMMMALPFYFLLPQAAGIAGAISVVVSGAMVIRYRMDVDFRKALIPSVLFIAICTVTISLSTKIDPALIKKIFGAFLVLLSVYFLFINKAAGNMKITLPVAIVFIIISALCDSLFGIGGPLMVLYFLSQTNSTREYLGTIQFFFFINGVYNTAFRFMRGILGIEQLVYIAVGAVCIFAGLLVANKIVDRLNANVIRKLTYIMIGISGIVNLF